MIHTRRPEAWAGLSDTDAALLDFLRRGGSTSELSPEDTARKTLALILEKGRLDRLLKVADSEPPRVRALLGAIAEQIGKNAAARARLRFAESALPLRLRLASRALTRQELAGQGKKLK